MQIKFNKTNFKLLFNKTFILIKKELQSYFSSPISYIVFVLFIIVLAILLYGRGRYTLFGTADLSEMFSYVAFAFAIIIPALTMGSISKEKQNGTVEYILTQPITEFQYLIAKFITYCILVILMLILTLPIPLLVNSFAGLDIGQSIMQYLGAFIFGVSLVSVGLAISSMFKNEIISFLTSLVVSILLIVIGSSVINFLPAGLNSITDKFSLLTHYQSISRGVIEMRDLLYFIALIFFFLYLAYYFIVRDKFPSKDISLKRIQISVLIVFIIALFIGSIGQLIPGRIDFTANKRYTLSTSSTNIINNLQDNLNLTLYASSNIPSEYQYLLTDIEDSLKDYINASKGKINLAIKQPDKDETVAKEAETNQITKSPFGVRTADSAQVVAGYFGLNLKYKDKSSSINFDFRNPSTLEFEYQITKNIKKLSDNSPKKIAILTNNVVHTKNTDLTEITKELADIYNLTDLTLTKENPTVPKDINAIIIAGPNQKFDDQVITNLKQYYENGGAILFMTNTFNITSQQLAENNENSLKDFFQNYGVSINQDLVYDLAKYNYIGVQSNLGTQLIKFPLFINSSASNDDTYILKNIKNVSILLGSDISIDQSKLKDSHVYNLLTTSAKSNVKQDKDLDISLEQSFQSKSSDKSRVMSVAIENSKSGRAVIVGDSGFLTDQVLNYLSQLQQERSNISFIINSIAWLSHEDSIGNIKSKATIAPLLNLQDNQATTLIISSIVIPIGLIIILAIIQFYNKRKLIGKIYSADNI